MPGKLPAKAFDIHPRPGLVGVSDEGKLWGPKVSLPLGFFLCKLDWGGWMRCPCSASWKSPKYLMLGSGTSHSHGQRAGSATEASVGFERQFYHLGLCPGSASY